MQKGETEAYTFKEGGEIGSRLLGVGAMGSRPLSLVDTDVCVNRLRWGTIPRFGVWVVLTVV